MAKFALFPFHPEARTMTVIRTLIGNQMLSGFYRSCDECVNRNATNTRSFGTSARDRQQTIHIKALLKLHGNFIKCRMNEINVIATR